MRFIRHGRFVDRGEALATQTAPASPETIARQFTRARKNKVEEILQTLVTLGQAREVEDGTFVGG